METAYSKERRHKKLILAAIDTSEKGKMAFDEWKESIDLDSIDYPSQKMLSAIGHHLSDDLISNQIRKVAKFTWLRSQMLLRAGFRAEATLVAEGIPTAWIKGTAVLARTKTEISKRPMDDIDLLVPRSYVSRAAMCLKEAGFKSDADEELSNRPEALTETLHALAFRDETGAEVDLHWRAFKGAQAKEAEVDLWSRVANAKLFGRDVIALSAEDLLVQIMATNREGNDAYWALDAMRVIEDNSLDFQLAYQIAKQRKLLGVFILGLAHLGEYKTDVIPPKSFVKIKLLAFLLNLGHLLSGTKAIRNLWEFTNLWAPRKLKNKNFDNQDESIQVLQPAQSISLKRNGTAFFRSPFATAGWNQAEAGGTWSSSRVAEIKYQTTNTNTSQLRAKATFSIISSEFSKLRAVAIYVNGKRAMWKILYSPLGRTQIEEFLVPSTFQQEQVTISFWVSSTIRPRKHKLNLDQRELGIYLQTIEIGTNPVE